MRKTLIFLFAFCAVGAAQNVRYDAAFTFVSSITTNLNQVMNAPPQSMTLAVCSSPAVLNTSGACINFATTYNSAGAACPNGQQDTPQPQPSKCQASPDAQGNIGFWAPPGTYVYTVCVQTTCYGPYTITLGGSGGVGSSLWSNLLPPNANLNLNQYQVVTSPLVTTFNAGDFGVSPLTTSAATTYSDNSTSTTDITPDLGCSVPTTSYHDCFLAMIDGFKQFSVFSHGGGHVGEVAIGSAIDTHSLNTSTYDSKFWVLDQSHAINTTMYDGHSSYTGNLLKIETATAAGTGWNGLVICAGASNVDASCPSANNQVVLRGDGQITATSGVFSGTISAASYVFVGAPYISGIIPGTTPSLSSSGKTALVANTDGDWYTSNSAGALSKLIKIGGTSDVTAQSTSQSSVTLATAPAAGNYNLRYYADVNTACTTGSNTVAFTLSWTDASLARTLTTSTLSMGTSTATSYLSGSLPIFVGSGNVSYTSTVTGTCGSGTSSYDVHISLTQ